MQNTTELHHEWHIGLKLWRLGPWGFLHGITMGQQIYGDGPDVSYSMEKLGTGKSSLESNGI